MPTLETGIARVNTNTDYGLAYVQWALGVKKFQAASNDSGLT
jgi:hypothetical protein